MLVARARGVLRDQRGPLAFFAATALVNVTNFGFHVIVSRALGTDAYGALSALLVVIVVLSVPLGALQLASSHAQAGAADSADARGLIGRTASAGVLGMGLVAVVSPLIAHFLHLGSVVPVLLIAAWLPLALVGAVPFGLLLARSRYGALTAGTLLGTGLARLLGAVALAPTLGTNGGLLATVLAQGVTTAVFLWGIRDQLRGGSEPVRLSSTQGLLSLLAMVGLALVTGVDTLLAQHVMPGADASVYAAAAVAGRMALFAPAAVALIVFPKFVAARKEGRSDERLVLGSLALVMAMGLIAAAVLAAVPDLVTRVLFGPEFARSADEVPLLALEGAALAVVSLMTYYHLARGGLTSLAAGVGALGAGAAIWIVQPSLHSLALLIAEVAWGLAIVMVVRAAWVLRRTESGPIEPVDEALITEAVVL